MKPHLILSFQDMELFTLDELEKFCKKCRDYQDEVTSHSDTSTVTFITKSSSDEHLTIQPKVTID